MLTAPCSVLQVCEGEKGKQSCCTRSTLPAEARSGELDDRHVTGDATLNLSVCHSLFTSRGTGVETLAHIHPPPFSSLALTFLLVKSEREKLTLIHVATRPDISLPLNKKLVSERCCKGGVCVCEGGGGFKVTRSVCRGSRIDS